MTTSAASLVSDPHVVQRAAVRAVAYADVFGYALDANQIWRYLHGVAATSATTELTLARSSAAGGPLACVDGLYTLRGREALVPLRQRRAQHAMDLWPIAVWYGNQIASLPFVRMVAVTGSLAWDNVVANADIDYFVIVEPDRLWVCRWLIAVLTETVRLSGVPLCPNYIISERELAMTDRNLYTAYELAQMKLVAGHDTYRRVRHANPWVQAFLPNAPIDDVPDVHGPPRAGIGRGFVRAARLVEPLLRSRIGATLDRLEMRYRIRKWTPKLQPGTEARFTHDCYKAHGSGHKAKVLAAFAERVQRIEAA